MSGECAMNGEARAAFLLEKTEWGGLLSPEEAKLAASCAQETRLAAGEALFREGDAGDCMAFIIEGRVRIIKKNVYFRKKIVAELGEGDILGEISLIDGSPRSASAECETDCVFLTLDRESFEALAEKDMALGYKLLRKLAELICRRLRETTRLYVDVEGEERARSVLNSTAPLTGGKPWMRKYLGETKGGE